MFQLLNAKFAPYLLTVSHPDSSPKTSIGSGQQAIAILRWSQAVRSEEQRLVRRPAVHVRQLLPSPRHDIGQQPRQATGQVVVTRGRQTYFGRFFSVHFTSSFCIAHSSLCKHIWISHWPTVTVFINKWCRRIGTIPFQSLCLWCYCDKEQQIVSCDWLACQPTFPFVTTL